MPFDWKTVWTQMLLYLPRIGGGLVIFLVFWLGAALAQRLVVRMSTLRRVDQALVVFCGRSIRLAIIAFGAVTALGTFGIDVSALVAGVGLSGFALGFALKDIISNALSGILIVLYRPFVENDRITMAPHEGLVREVNLRYTVLETAENKRIFIPNSLLFTNAVVVQSGTAAPSGQPPTVPTA